MKTKICRSCGEEKPLNQFGRNGWTYKGTEKFKPRCKPCNYKYEFGLFTARIHKAVGGKENMKCSACGYDKLKAALEFHHPDPSTKKYEIGRMQNHSYELLKKEINKCVLLCCRCHREYHAGILRL